MMRSEFRLLLKRDSTVLVNSSGEEHTGPAIAGSEDLNTGWLDWLKGVIKNAKSVYIKIEAPADLWYWALLVKPDNNTDQESESAVTVVRTGGRVGSEADLFALESLLPVPVDETVARFTSAGRDVVACAVEKQVLEHWITQVESVGVQVVSIRPSDVLPLLKIHISKPVESIIKHLEFRCGEYEHALTRRRRNINYGILAAGWLLVCVFISWGWNKESAQYEKLAADANNAAPILARHALPPEHANKEYPERILANLVLKSARKDSPTTEQYATKPVVKEFVSILSHWPKLDDIEISNWVLDGTRLILKGTAPDIASADAIAHSLKEALTGDDWEDFAPSSRRKPASDRYEFDIVGLRKRTNIQGGR